MPARESIALVLLAIGILVGVGSACALLLIRSAFDRLHLLAPAATVGIVVVVAAIVVREGASALGTKAILTGALLLLQGPIVTHMTARARWHARTGRGRSTRGDGWRGLTRDASGPGHERGAEVTRADGERGR